MYKCELCSNSDILSIGSELQYANYVITVYGAFGLPNSYYETDKHLTKAPSTFLMVSFNGLSVFIKLYFNFQYFIFVYVTHVILITNYCEILGENNGPICNQPPSVL